MRMAFLIEGRYAPYPKWFGYGFRRPALRRRLVADLDAVLAAADWRPREAALAEAYLALGALQLARGVPARSRPRIEPFHERPFSVINADDDRGA